MHPIVVGLDRWLFRYRVHFLCSSLLVSRPVVRAGLVGIEFGIELVAAGVSGLQLGLRAPGAVLGNHARFRIRGFQEAVEWGLLLRLEVLRGYRVERR